MLGSKSLPASLPLAPHKPEPYVGPSRDEVLAMRQARHHDTLVGLDAIPDAERELMYRRAAMLACALDNLILERVLTDTVERSANLLDEAVAEARRARLVVVLRVGDVRFSKRGDSDRMTQGAG